MKGLAHKIVQLALALIPTPIRVFLWNALFVSFPTHQKDASRRAYHMADIEWSLRNLKRKGFTPSVILDVGAFEGQWTCLVKGIFPQAHVLMLEAQPAQSGFLEAVKRRYAGTVDYVIALLSSEANQTVDFYQMGSGSSALEENSDVPRVRIPMLTQTLDRLAQARSLDRVSLLKLDTQGYELEILKGAEQLLSQVEVVLMEVAFVMYNGDAPIFHEVVRFMDERGFWAYDICSLVRTSTLVPGGEDDSLVQTDLLFVRRTSAWRPDAFRFRT